jgi:hypothetical protein
MFEPGLQLILHLSADRFTRPRRFTSEVLDVLPFHSGFPAYPAKVPLTLHPQLPTQGVPSIATAVSGLGLEAASKSFPKHPVFMGAGPQPLAKTCTAAFGNPQEQPGSFFCAYQPSY